MWELGNECAKLRKALIGKWSFRNVTSIHKNDMSCKNDGILSTLLDAAKDLVWLPRLLWEESNDHP